ncbi:hypothetical protein ARALYDRAFT_338560 [Arabidopsis lyrata subsp. lyrata]|uniref:Arabidopsis retrotransposon Orf1 C-terminal domain-containing protein n=1 Tax=Arabidopsis lyrata subsp. lyrata TaxID=81972 RepID=D7KZ06_ARALL|nr:hypothetical protein ARALYDRAFT_338560 [Arabidopsis lyrata subsp. lyrata]
MSSANFVYIFYILRYQWPLRIPQGEHIIHALLRNPSTYSKSPTTCMKNGVARDTTIELETKAKRNKALDLDDDVIWMLDTLRLRRFMESIRREIYEEETRQFLATVSLAFPRTSSPLARDGILYFTINGNHFNISIPHLGRALGFDYQDAIDFGPEEHGDAWKRIGKGPFSSGKTKSALISHPAIRCVHKLLATSIFARTAHNNVLGDELLVLKIPFVDFPRINYASLFAKRLVKIKHEAIHYTNNDAFLSFGGIITAILEAAGVDLTDRPFTAEENYFDLERLSTMRIFEGSRIDPDCFGYRYNVSPRLIRTIMLPCPTIPRLRNGATRWDPESSEFLSLQTGERLPFTLAGYVKKKELDSRRATQAARSHETDSSCLGEERALEQRLAEQIALMAQMERMIRDPRHSFVTPPDLQPPRRSRVFIYSFYVFLNHLFTYND